MEMHFSVGAAEFEAAAAVLGARVAIAAEGAGGEAVELALRAVDAHVERTRRRIAGIADAAFELESHGTRRPAGWAASQINRTGHQVRAAVLDAICRSW